MDTAAQLDALQRAFSKFDRNQSAFAKAIGTSQQRVSYVFARGNVLPADLVIRCERATGISRHELRPDLYPVDFAPTPQQAEAA